MSMVVRRTIIVAAILLFVVAMLINRAFAAVSTPTKTLTNVKNPIAWQKFGQYRAGPVGDHYPALRYGPQPTQDLQVLS